MRRKNGVACRAMLLTVLSLLGSIAFGGTMAVGDLAHTKAAKTAVNAGSPTTAVKAVAKAIKVSAKVPVRGQVQTCRYTRTRPTRANLGLIDTAIVCLTDRERIRHGLRGLRANRDLQGVAASQTEAMVVGDYFGDLDVTGRTPWQRITTSPYGSKGVVAAQNIGWGNGAFATPEAMMSAWMHSPPHRQIVLTAAYRDIGVGVAPSAPRALTGSMSGATYAVELAARR